MSGQHPFLELTKDLAPDYRRRIDAIKRDPLARMPLHELRRARSTLATLPLGRCRIAS